MFKIFGFLNAKMYSLLKYRLKPFTEKMVEESEGMEVFVWVDSFVESQVRGYEERITSKYSEGM